MKIACVQMDVSIGNVPTNLRRIKQCATEAADNGAELVVFPECAITGYCFESKQDAIAHACKVPGEHSSDLSAISRSLGVTIIAGSLERSGDDLFNVAVCVGPKGLLGSYRKTHLPALGVDHFTQPGYTQDDQAAYQVLELGNLRIGMLICYDASFPEASRILALRGADLIVLPTNWPPGAEQTADYVINARASENKIFYAAANRVGHENGFDFIGKSKICDVHGSTLAFADHRREEILYADIDIAQARDKKIHRGKGHSIDRFRDRRPSLYNAIATPHATNKRVPATEPANESRD